MGDIPYPPSYETAVKTGKGYNDLPQTPDERTPIATINTDATFLNDSGAPLYPSAPSYNPVAAAAVKVLNSRTFLYVNIALLIITFGSVVIFFAVKPVILGQDVLHGHVNASQMLLTGCMSSNQQLMWRVNQTDQDLTTCKKDFQAINQDLNLNAAQLAMANERVKQLETQNNNLHQEMEAQMAAAKERVKQLETQNYDLHQEMEAKSFEIKDLNSRLTQKASVGTWGFLGALFSASSNILPSTTILTCSLLIVAFYSVL